MANVTIRGGRVSPLTALAGALVLAGVVGVLRDGSAGVEPPARCEEGADPVCAEAPEAVESSTLPSLAAGPTLAADEVCRNVGYLCAELAHGDRVRLRRWKDFSGTLVVHVPRPDFEDASVAARLQTAAATGLRAWNEQPFQILTDLRGEREAHFAVQWTRGLGGSQIGVARTQWSTSTGLRVVSIELTTRSAFDPNRVIDPNQIRLTAAHEMGHALGLPHSDSRRDVMYPTNTATSLTAQDYRTMESLYALPDGAEIVR